MQIKFIRHVFATFTYERNRSSNDTWDGVSKDYNRFIQKFRRLNNCKVQYLRTLEAHKDSYPHIHSLLQFPTARIRVENSNYFENNLWLHWKAQWSNGLSDYQVPYSKREGQLSYILKYISKNSTSKNIWKKILSVQPVCKPGLIQSDTTPAIVETPTSAVTSDTFKSITSANPIHYRNQKLCSWSRAFDWAPFFKSA